MDHSEVHRCKTYLIFRGEIYLVDGLRACIYFLLLAYCFIGLSSITDRFFRSMENVVKQTKRKKVLDIEMNTHSGFREVKVWNHTIADITLLAFGTSFPQISLATIDAIRNIGSLTAGGLGPGTLVGSAAFDLFPIHAVCVVAPKVGTVKKISDLGVWLVEMFWSFWAYVWLYIILEVWTPNEITLWESLLTVLQFGLLLIHAFAQDRRWPYLTIPIGRSERPKEWVAEDGLLSSSADDEYDINSVQASDDNQNQSTGDTKIGSTSTLEQGSNDPFAKKCTRRKTSEDGQSWLFAWQEQFSDALGVNRTHSDKALCWKLLGVIWLFIIMPWRLLFAFVPPYRIAHGWVAFICSLIFMTAISFLVTKLTDQISCTTGIDPYVIAFTALASGTSWPDLIASKIAAERQLTADSAIANIICSNSVNIYVGIGVPWLIDTGYNFFVYHKPLYIPKAEGLSFSILVFFATSIGCISVLLLRRLVLGGELGGPKLWAWTTAVYFMLLWIAFLILSSLKVSGKL